MGEAYINTLQFYVAQPQIGGTHTVKIDNNRRTKAKW